MHIQKGGFVLFDAVSDRLLVLVHESCDFSSVDLHVVLVHRLLELLLVVSEVGALVVDSVLNLGMDITHGIFVVVNDQ